MLLHALKKQHFSEKSRYDTGKHTLCTYMKINIHTLYTQQALLLCTMLHYGILYNYRL